MPTKLLLPLCTLALLSACGSTVIEEADRALPDAPPSEAVQGIQEKQANLAESFIAFTGTKGDAVTQEGKFEQFTCALTLEDGSPKDLSLTIDLDSIETQSQKLTDHLKNEDFFDVPLYPEATFIADAFVELGGDTFMISGMLTMHGVTNKETITATITDTYLTANHSIRRTDYGIGGPADGLKAVDTEVPMEIKVVFQ